MGACMCFFVTLAFWSLIYINLEIDQPFGADANDLPVKHIQADFNRSLLELLKPLTQQPPEYEWQSPTGRESILVSSETVYANENTDAVSPKLSVKVRKTTSFPSLRAHRQSSGTDQGETSFNPADYATSETSHQGSGITATTCGLSIDGGFMYTGVSTFSRQVTSEEDSKCVSSHEDNCMVEVTNRLNGIVQEMTIATGGPPLVVGATSVEEKSPSQDAACGKPVAPPRAQRPIWQNKASGAAANAQVLQGCRYI